MDRIKLKIRKWQLLRWKGGEEAGLESAEFLSVGKKAFRRQKKLREVRFPAALTAIKTRAFTGCDALETVVLPPENGVGISLRAFEGCGSLRRVENAGMIRSVGKSAFRKCAGLKELLFGRELRRVGEGAFADCKGLERAFLPSCTETLGKGCFRGCTSLNDLTLEEGLDSLPKDGFRDCAALTGLSLPSSVRELPDGVFRSTGIGKNGMVAIPPTVRRIGRSAFRDCRSLAEVSIELGTVEIGAFAFAGCSALREVSIPHSVRKIGFGAFGLGVSGQKIRILAGNEYMCKRLRRKLLLCGSAGRTIVVMNGKTLAERKKERHSKSLDRKPEHIS